MTIKRRTIAAIMCSVALLAVLVSAQEKKSTQVFSSSGGQVVVSGSGEGHYAFGSQGDNTFVFVSSEMSFDGKMVKGAPYSAQAVTEMIQTLADGNRIVRRSNASVYRDSEGRTRREQSINHVGSFAASGEPQQTIFINDPVAQVNYILDTKNRTARRMDLNMVSVSGSGIARKKMAEARARAEEKTTDSQHAEHSVQIARGGTFEMRVPGPGGIGFGPSMARTALESKNAKKESLGKQNIEGVEAEGTRYTITIAAGEIGNEAPINIVSETWYSSELQTVVMSRHSDPRMGENTYRLTNINRSEPPHSLFELPSDYTVKETIEPGIRYKIESEVRKGIEKQSQ